MTNGGQSLRSSEDFLKISLAFQKRSCASSSTGIFNPDETGLNIRPPKKFTLIKKPVPNTGTSIITRGTTPLPGISRRLAQPSRWAALPLTLGNGSLSGNCVQLAAREGFSATCVALAHTISGSLSTGNSLLVSVFAFRARIMPQGWLWVK